MVSAQETLIEEWKLEEKDGRRKVSFILSLWNLDWEMLISTLGH
jgi:hypothetical protein